MKDVLQSRVNEATQVPLPRPRSGRAAATERTKEEVLMRRFSSYEVRTADTVSLTLALLIGVFGAFLRTDQRVTHFLALRISIQNLVAVGVLLVVWRFIFWAIGLYQPRTSNSQLGFFARVPAATLLATLAVTGAMLASGHAHRQTWHVSVFFGATATLLMTLNRVVLFTYHDAVRPALRKKLNVIVVGTGPRAFMMTQQLLANTTFDYQICGFVDSDPQPECKGIAPVLGSLEDLEMILMRRPVDEVLIALPLKSSFSDVEMAISTCGHAGITTRYSVDLFHSKVTKNQTVDETTGVRVLEMVHSDHRLILKGIFDRVASFFGLLLLLPVFLLIALAIKLTSKGPVFFVQQRWGKNKRTFGMFKFRSMVTDAERMISTLEQQNDFGGPMFKMKNDPRVTTVGRLLRRTSLDELPQLLNVLLGDMSLVGPRPLPNRDVALFSEPWTMRRFSVKPGITGLWQVSGRSETDFDQTIRLDLHYIDHWSLLLDLKILAKTVAVVLWSKGAY